jgi:hypothetical protein
MSVCEYDLAHYTAKVSFAISRIAANDIRDRLEHLQKGSDVLVVLKLLVRGLWAVTCISAPTNSWTQSRSCLSVLGNSLDCRRLSPKRTKESSGWKRWCRGRSGNNCWGRRPTSEGFPRYAPPRGHPRVQVVLPSYCCRPISHAL